MRSKYLFTNKTQTQNSCNSVSDKNNNNPHHHRHNNNSKNEKQTMASNVAHYRSIGSIDSEASLSSCSVSDQEFEARCNTKAVNLNSASRRAFSVSSTTSSASLTSNADTERKFYHRFFRKINSSSHKSESYAVNQSLGMINTIGVRVEIESTKPTEYSLDHLLQSISLPFSAHRDEPTLSLVNKAHAKLIQLLRTAIDEQRVHFHSGTTFFKHIFDASVAQLWVKIKFASRDKQCPETWSYFFLEDFHTAVIEGRRPSHTTPYDIQMLKWTHKRTANVQSDSSRSYSATHILQLLRNFREPEFENQSRQQQTVLNLYAFLAPLFGLEIVDLCFVLRYDSSKCDFADIPLPASAETTTPTSTITATSSDIVKDDENERSSSVTSGCSSWAPSEDDNKPMINSDCDSKKDYDDNENQSASSGVEIGETIASPETETETETAAQCNKVTAIKSAMQVLTFSNVRAMKRFRLKTRDSPPQRPHSTIIESVDSGANQSQITGNLKSFVSVDNLMPSSTSTGGRHSNADFNQTRIGSALVTSSFGSLAFCRKLISKTRSALSVDRIDSASEQPSPVVSSARCSTSSVASSSQSRLFGVDIESHVPVSILNLIKAFVLSQGLVAQGIFRKSANARNCRELRKLLEEYEETSAETAGLFDDNSEQKSEEELLERIKEYSVYEMASTLKEFVRQLPSGAVAPESQYDRLREIADKISKFKEDSKSQRSECIESLKELIKDHCNRPVLSILLSVLYQVSCSEENVKENLMSPNNLAVCIGASLISASMPNSVSNTNLDVPKASNTKLLSMSSTSIRDLFSSKSNPQFHNSASNLSSLPASGLEPERISALVAFLIENCNDILGPNTSDAVFKLLNVEHSDDENNEKHQNYTNEELEDEVFFDDIIAEYGPRNSTVLKSTQNFDEARSLSNMSGDIFDDYYEDDTINASDCTVRSIFQSNYESFHKYCSAYEQKRIQMKERLREESKHPLVLDDDEISKTITEDQLDSPTNSLATADYRAEFGRYVAKDSKIRLRKFRNTSSVSEIPAQVQTENEPVTGLRMRELGSDDDDADSSPPTPSAPQTLSRFFVTATVNENRPSSTSMRKNPIRGLFRKNRQRYSIGSQNESRQSSNNIH